MDIDRFTSNEDSPRILVCSGAGLSRESGICTFRDSPDGLWENFDLNVVCNAETFDDNYDEVHRFYNARRKDLGRVGPNRMHEYLNELEFTLGDDRFLHMTANVDDLIERHGGSAMHLHGTLTEVVQDWKTNDPKVLDIGYTDYVPRPGIDRPNVVMFGDFYRYENGIRKGVYTDRNHVLAHMRSEDLVIVIGSSDSVIMWSQLVGWGPSYSVNINPMQHEYDHAFSKNIYKGAQASLPELKEIVSKYL